MTSIGQIVHAVRSYRKFVTEQVKRARQDAAFGRQVLEKWDAAKSRIGTVVTATGLKLPALALPELDEPGEIARYLGEEGLPGDFPFLTAAYPEQYLESGSGNGSPSRNGAKQRGEEPTRLF